MKMDIHEILWKPENEIIEFKLAGNDYDLWKLCDYVSALWNEANLNDLDYAYLVFWVEPKNHTAQGTRYRQESLPSVKHCIFQKTQHSVNVSEQYVDKKRLVVFEIPKWPVWKIITSNGHAFWRENESITALSNVKRQKIESGQTYLDWSSKIVSDANLEDLDAQALLQARKNFIKKNSKIPQDEIHSWSDTEFLNRARITTEAKITRAALILLWKESSAHKIGWIVQVSWVLKNIENEVKDYEHFYPPFILSVEKIFQKIRNLKYRYLQDWTIFPEEVEMYDSWAIRELLHNCIAHQDYSMQSKINLIEFEDGKLIFDNAGIFIPESIDRVIESESPPTLYRNPCLAQAMLNVDMIDTVWSWIKRVFKTQRLRFFPLPSYNFENSCVRVELYGKILDMKYANILVQNTELTLQEIIILDKIQKNKILEIPKEGIIDLKKKWLVEGRYPNMHISGDISWKIWKKTEYIRLKGFNDDYYVQMIIEYLEKYTKAHKQEIKDLLWNKLPDILSEKQKEDKINNLLNSKLSREWILKSIQWKTNAKKDRLWILKK